MITLNLDFAKLAIKYLKNTNEALLIDICQLPSADHLFFHAYNSNPDMNFDTKKEFIRLFIR